jgi:hypothetical protein
MNRSLLYLCFLLLVCVFILPSVCSALRPHHGVVRSHIAAASDAVARIAARRHAHINSAARQSQHILPSGRPQQPMTIPPFVNPTGVITVPTHSNITILRNHSAATTGFADFVTNIGSTNCKDWRGELTEGIDSCHDEFITLWGITSINGEFLRTNCMHV